MNWLRDPLVFFLLAGAGLFVIADWFGEDEISYAIELSPQALQRLSDQWNMQMRRPPSSEELNGLVEQHIKEEIYYREAQRLDLETNDTIVRRRMVQKLTFLTEDIATATAPTETELLQYYETHRETYMRPKRVSFKHRYFSKDRRQDAQADAVRAVKKADLVGDPFMLQREYALRSAREIRDLFGQEFSDKLMTLTKSANWQGPIKSAYGWHPVLISSIQEEAIESFEQVRERVKVDLQQTARETANQRYYAQLREKYRVIYPDER